MNILILRAFAVLLVACSGFASAQIVNPVFIQSGAGAISRTYLDKARDVVSAKDYGAKGNGVADDTAAIQAALNTGKDISLGGGTYLLSTTLTLRGGAQRVQFDRNAVLRPTKGFAPDASLGFIHANGSGPCEIISPHINGYPVGAVSTSTYTVGIVIESASPCTVKGGTLENVFGWCVQILSASVGSKVSEVNLNNCGTPLSTPTYGATGGIVAYGNDSSIVNNFVLNTVSKAIAIGGMGSSAIGNTVVGTTDATGEGIYVINSSHNARVVGNHIEDTNGNGIKVTTNVTDFVVTGNTIKYTTGAYVGIFTQGATLGTVSNNKISRRTNTAPAILIGSDGPSATSPLDITVSGNALFSSVKTSSIVYGVEQNTGILVSSISAVNPGKNVSVTGNSMSGFQVGIIANFTNGVTVGSNTIETAIGITTDGSNVAIVGNNLVVDVTGISLATITTGSVDANRITFGSVSAGSGITASSDCTDLVVSNNWVYGVVNDSVTSVGISFGGAPGVTRGAVVGNTITYKTGSPYYYGILASMTNGILSGNRVRTGATGTTSIAGGVNTVEVNTVAFP